MQTDIDTDTPNRDVLGRVWYLLTLSRPRFWLYLAGPIVVAVAFGATSVSELFLPENIVFFAYFLFPANVFLYGVNDVFDADVDVVNPKKEGRETRWQGDPVVAASVVITTALGIVIFAISPQAAWPYLLGFFILGFQYSAPPLRFKTTPIFDSLSNGLYILPGAAAYATVTGSQPPLAAVAGGWFWTMGMHTFSAIPDIEPDRAAGIQTTATFLGEPRVYTYCLCCWLAAAVSFAFLDNRIALLLLAYPVIVFAIYWSDIAVDRAYWWYPAVNTIVGMLLTMGALWRLLYG
ncbi:prenyltransferase [Haloquadratum walsbyi]|uniref:Lycopene elongase / lycopene 1,2-hydratase n=1 Tax=Haloquadratum walsbyi (strain DSM 16854 / JCM 12705 / C23) TaxID=768065 RepID=G0LJV2_HALWC|nr:prenyltransferase [Haloquadratum walsbyi]CCC41036.1 lycopene elongase / lycopene 1,2-hydratase [Haloquadratum walsbyi C23]